MTSRILFFTKGGPAIASSRYRAFFLAHELERLGHHTHVIPVEAGFWPYLRWLFSPYDILVLQRTIYHRGFVVAAVIAWLCGKRFVFDLDDAIWAPPAKRLKLLVYLASVVTCGSRIVFEWASTRNRARYLHNGLPLELFPLRMHEPNALTIGWAGLGQHQIYNLKMLLPILQSLEVPFRFTLLGANGNAEIHALFDEHCGFPVRIIDRVDYGDPGAMARAMQEFTIGVIPLTSDQPLNEARHLKLLEYMACSVPFVASPRTAVREMAAHARCGFLAETPHEWKTALTALLRDQALRMREGDQGRHAVEEQFSSAAMAREFLRIVGWYT